MSTANSSTAAALTQRVSTLAIASTLTLIALVCIWQLSSALTPARWFGTALLTVPLWLALSGLLRHRPGTRAWTTLCAIPSLTLGVMELIANPGQRSWAAACMLLSFALFVLLALLLRVQQHRQ